MNGLIPATGNSKVIFLTRAKRSFLEASVLVPERKQVRGLKHLLLLHGTQLQIPTLRTGCYRVCDTF